jgi:hypothetical protein
MAQLWKLLFLALPVVAAMPEPAAAHPCRVKVSLDDIKYLGEDIGGGQWNFVARAGLNLPPTLKMKNFSNPLTLNQILNLAPFPVQSLLIDENLGVVKGRPVTFVIQTESEATETRGKPRVTGTNGKSELFSIEKCGVPHRFEFITYAVPVERVVNTKTLTAQMRFTYKIEIDP